jgi:hypothetical protein
VVYLRTPTRLIRRSGPPPPQRPASTHNWESFGGARLSGHRKTATLGLGPSQGT